MKTYDFSNFKGGVGKTTAAFNLAYEFSSRGKRVLLIDMDPQGTLSSWCRDGEGVRIKDKSLTDKCSISNLLIPREFGWEPKELDELMYETAWPGVSIVPANLTLQRAKDAVLNNPYALAQAIERLTTPFDMIFIDSRPDLDMKTTNAYVAASHIIIPVRFDGSFNEGLSESISAIKETCADLRCPTKRYRVLPVGVKARVKRDEAGTLLLNAALSDDCIFDTSIRDTTKLGEATMAGKALAEYVKPTRTGWGAVEDFKELADEIESWED